MEGRWKCFGVYRSCVSSQKALRAIKSEQFSLAALSAVKTSFGQKCLK